MEELSGGSMFLKDEELEREIARRPEVEREIFMEVFSGVGRLLLEGSPRRILDLERGLREERRGEETPEDPEDASEELLGGLEVENLLRVYARFRSIERRSVSGVRLRERLGVSRQRLEQLRRRRRLLAVKLPFRQSYYYPVWQFTETGEPMEEMPRLIGVAEEAGMEPLDLDAFMVSESAGDGAPPYKLLKSGREEEVLSLVRAALAGGA